MIKENLLNIPQNVNAENNLKDIHRNLCVCVPTCVYKRERERDAHVEVYKHFIIFLNVCVSRENNNQKIKKREDRN